MLERLRACQSWSNRAKKIDVKAYRKLKDISLEFSSSVNAISGTNGTCKTSLLHVIGNSYQKVPSNSNLLSDKKCMSVLRKINSSVNPKIEALTRDAKNYVDPAKDIPGILYSVEYDDGSMLGFRKHNSEGAKGGRYSLKPNYSSGKGESLPFATVVYLGLARLFPFGEFLDEDKIKFNREFLPQKHAEALFDNYRKLSRLDVEKPKSQQMGDIKTRVSFSSGREGIDSNTISAGEDNLFIILLSLQSLAYFKESLVDSDSTEALLLIDEIDATLHPSLQEKLVDLFMTYSEKWGIQIIFTTHSLSLLEYLFEKRQRVIYLRDNVSDVILMDNPNMYNIRMALKEQTHRDIYLDKNVPIFSEDNEARLLILALFGLFAKASKEFARISSVLHLVEGDFGSDNLRKLFKDAAMRESTMASICILDGDQSSEPSFNIVALPGNNAPEAFMYEYCELLLEEDDAVFWRDKVLLDLGYTKTFYIDIIQQQVIQLEKSIEDMKRRGESTDGVRRDKMKKIFKSNEEFFTYAFKRWMHDERNREQLEGFYKQFHNMYLKVSRFHGVDQAAWPKTAQLDFSLIYE